MTTTPLSRRRLLSAAGGAGPGRRRPGGNRKRGIYQARLFNLNLAASGRFVIPAHLGLDAKRDIVSAEASLVLGISDPRGVGNDPEVTIAGNAIALPPQGAAGGRDALAGPPAIPLGPINLAAATPLEFSFPLALTGTERLAIAPTGEANTVSLRSDWRHPSFGGRFLPREREVGDGGFTARWEVSHLARNFANALGATTTPAPEGDRSVVHGPGEYLSAIRTGGEITASSSSR